MESFKIIQRFVILMYSKTSDHKSINKARMDMFFLKNHPNIESIPPTENALLQHTKRAIFQTGVWSRWNDSFQNLPSPTLYGWKRSDIDPNIPWEPIWFTNGEASKEIREFIKCNCSSSAGCVNCKCSNATLQCTILCKCKCDSRYSFTN